MGSGDPRTPHGVRVSLLPMRRTVLPVLVLGLVLGACSSEGESDAATSSLDKTPTTESTPTSDDTSDDSDSSSTEESDDDCTRFPAARTRGLGDGARRGVTVGKTAYAAEVGDDADGYLAVALTVTKDGESHPVVVAAPIEEGEGLTLATDSALPFLSWGDMAVEGSMGDDLRDTVGNSEAAEAALGCL